MATHLDLQEQEQIDDIKAFWKQYGNLITWVITLALAGFAALNGWNWWQREQAVKASAIYEELDRALGEQKLDRAQKAFDDLKGRHPGTLYAAQGGLLLAHAQSGEGQADAARGTLEWVAGQSKDEALQALAHLRLAGLLLDQKAFDDALRQVDAVKQPEFAALASDRRGDVLLAQGKKAEAVQAWQAAWKGVSDKQDYRQAIEAKLNAQGAQPQGEAK